MQKIGVIHTTPATVQGLKNLIVETIPEVEVVNILDDSMLSDMIEEREVEAVKERWLTYAELLEKTGVTAILSACSTVGEFAEEADRLLATPVYRIDEAMAEQAIKRGGQIKVLATLNSTLVPTENLLKKIAEKQVSDVVIESILVEGAYDALTEGDKFGHDTLIKETIIKCLETADVIVLAQASMVNAVEGLSGVEEKVLTSPVLGIRKLKQDLLLD